MLFRSYLKRIDLALPLNLQCGIEQAVSLQDAAERGADGIAEVSADWVLSNKERVQLLDVRRHDEPKGPLSHIPDVVHVPSTEERCAGKECRSLWSP